MNGFSSADLNYLH